MENLKKSIPAFVQEQPSRIEKEITYIKCCIANKITFIGMAIIGISLLILLLSLVNLFTKLFFVNMSIEINLLVFISSVGCMLVGFIFSASTNHGRDTHKAYQKMKTLLEKYPQAYSKRYYLKNVSYCVKVGRNLALKDTKT